MVLHQPKNMKEQIKGHRNFFLTLQQILTCNRWRFVTDVKLINFLDRTKWTVGEEVIQKDNCSKR